MSSQSLPPKETALFPVLRAKAERDWREWNPNMVDLLEQQGKLDESLDSAAEQAVLICQQAMEAGLSRDQAQELMNEVLYPPAERIPEDDELDSQDF